MDEGDLVAVLSRRRMFRRAAQESWQVGAIEQTVIPVSRFPDFLPVALAQIETEGDFSVLERLHQAFPKDEFFKAYYEVSTQPLPAQLADYWGMSGPPLHVLTITYASPGPVEMTHTWFNSRRVTLLAGSLDVKLE